MWRGWFQLGGGPIPPGRSGRRAPSGPEGMADDTQRLEDRSDDELVVQAQRRRTDPSGARALEILVERYRRQRFALARRYGGGVDADDLAQEAALALMRAVDTYRSEEGPAGPWIWRWMWGSSLRSAMKSWSLRGALPLDDVGACASEPADDRFEESMEEAVLAAQVRDQERTAVQNALRRLPAAAHDAVVFPGLVGAALRRMAVAMLRHPSIRPAAPLVRRHWVEHGGEVTPLVAVTDGTGNVQSVPDPRGAWLNLAACRDMSPQTFWGRDTAMRAVALATCASCPVRQDCLSDALALPAGGGIRAGTSEKERRVLKRRLLGNEVSQT